MVPTRRTLEWGATISIALLLAGIHDFSSLPLTFALISVVLGIPVLFKKPEYAAYTLAVFLPLRDIILVSVIFLHRALIWGLFLWSLIRHLTLHEVPYSRNLAKFTWRMLLFVLAVGISLMITASKFYSTVYITPEMFKSMFFSNALRVVENLLLVYILYYSLRTTQHIWRFLTILLANSVFIAILGIVQYRVGGRPPLVGFLFNPEYMFYGRATSVFSSPNNLGHFLAPMVGILLILLFFMHASKSLRFLLLLPGLLLVLGAIILSFSRGAMLTVFFCVLTLGYFYYVHFSERKLSFKLVLVVLLIVVMVLAAFQYYDVYLRTRLAGYKEQDYRKALNWIRTSSDFGRKFAAFRALKTFARHPLWGIGFDVFLGEQIGGGYAVDNQYLKIMVDTGLLGFVPFVLMLILIMRTGIHTWKVRRKQNIPKDEDILFLILLTGLSTFLFSYLFADTLHLRSISGNLWMFSGAIFVLDRLYASPPGT